MLDKDGILVDDLYIVQGEDWSRTYPLTDPNTGNPINVTGWTLRGQIRQGHLSPILYEWKTTNSNVQLGNGFAKIQVSDTDSDGWTWVDLSAKYDLELVDLGGQVQIISKGDVFVTANITH